MTHEENLSTDYTEESQFDETTENVVLDENNADPEPCHSQNLHQKRERKPPKYLEDYITDVDNTDVSHVSIDYCYRAVHGIPQSYSDALRSPEGPGWDRAMKEELDSLEENDTFELTSLYQRVKIQWGGNGSMPLKKMLKREKYLKQDTLQRGTAKQRA